MMKQETRAIKMPCDSKPQKKSSMGSNGRQLSCYLGWTKTFTKKSERRIILQWEQEGGKIKFGHTHRLKMQGVDR